MKDQVGPERELAAFEAAMEESIKRQAAKLFNAIKNQPRESELIKDVPIVRVMAVYIDRDHNLPLGLYEYDVIGTREEIARLVESKHEDFINSAAYRKNQSLIFNTLKKKGVRDSKILDVLFPDASKDERAKSYNRLKRSWARVKAARKGTKS